MKHRNLVKLGNAALAFGLITSTVAGALLIVTSPASAASIPTNSTTTIAWGTDHTDTTDPNYQAFKNVTVSVSQTKNLVNQGITVSWAGARTTSTGDFSTDFMQVMQCWGDDPAGPSPEQCHWGAPSATIGNLTGVNVARRDLVLGEDPAQDASLSGPGADPDLLLDPPIESPNLRAYRVPFRPVSGALAKSTNDLAKLFDSSTTNEVSAGRTGVNGTGEIAFETQTSLESPSLGCGADTTAANGATAPRSCWLAIVPRGSLNLDGTLTANTSGRISGSPLSASAWKERMVVKLDFQPVSQSCPLGNPEQRIVGAENIAEAITSWQPALCQSGTTYGYSLIGDDEARQQIVSSIDGAARLAIVSNPLDKEEAGDATLAYAPVAESAIVVAYNIDYRLYPGSAAEDKNGLQVQDLTLNARLVAKLLTQSYRVDTPGQGATNAVVTSNPISIITDPEFLKLNPDFVGSSSDNAPEGLMVALGNSDANSLVWSWVRADPLAQSFLAGDTDDWGMKINPNYLPLNLATDATVDSFPKADLTIAKSGTGSDEPGYGTLDMRPYMNDMHEGALRTLKSDANDKSSWDPFKQPKAYVSLGAQVPGQRFLLSITDAASAARYGLNTAKLVNGAGQPTAPTAASIAKGASLMGDSPDAPSVKIPDTSKRAVGAYPLAMMSYAAVNVCASTPTELKDYAKLINYAVGAGQISGDARGALPRGYVPLDAASIAQAQTAAAGLVDKKAVAKTCDPPTPTPTPTATPTAQPPVVPPVVLPTPVATSAAPTPVVVTDPDTDAVVQMTTDQPLSGGRAGFAAALALGVPSMIAGPFLSRRGRKLGRLMNDES